MMKMKEEGTEKQGETQRPERKGKKEEERKIEGCSITDGERKR